MSLYVTPSLPGAQDSLGRANVGFVPFPVFGKGRMAGSPILDAHGFGIPSGSGRKWIAAQFIEFMHTKERLRAMWELSRQMPVDEAFDAAVIDDPFLRRVYDTWFAGPHVPYIGDLTPVPFWNEVMFVVSQRILSAAMSAEQAAEFASTFTDRWRAANPDMVTYYARWARELSL